MLWTVVLEKTLQSPLDCKDILPVHSKGNQSWIFIGRTDAEAETLATWWKELTHLKRPWCWEILKAGEGDDRGWDGWMASLTQWIWVWASSRRWWRIGKPDTPQSMRSQSQTWLSDWTTANEVIGLGGLRKLPKLCFRVKLGFQSSKSHFCKILKLPWDLTLRTQQRNALDSPRDFSVLKTPVICLYESVQGL